MAGPGAGRRVIAVTRYSAGMVTGVDLTTLLGRSVSDPIDVLREEGWQSLRDRIASAPAATHVTLSADSLDIPVDLGAHHIAAGTNYPEHAGEAQVEDGPFLFAKLVEPTAPRATVAARDALLDYEVELAFVTTAPVVEGARPDILGLVVCNDYTDRATLLRHVDVWDPASGDGFTTGKSFPGYLPVGDLFVVPRDVRAFAASLELRLEVNGEERQRARVSEWIWDLDRLLEEAWARRNTTWEHRGARVSLFADDENTAGDPSGNADTGFAAARTAHGAGGEPRREPTVKTIPARTLLMAGTPSGTVFHGVPTSTRVRGAFRWLLGGWDVPIGRRVVETHIEDERQAGRYLEPGDRVVIHVERLGTIGNEIVP